MDKTHVQQPSGKANRTHTHVARARSGKQLRRVPVAVREDGEEEKVAAKVGGGGDLQEEEEGKAIQGKLEAGTAIQRQVNQDEES